MLGDGSYLSFWAVYLEARVHLCRGKGAWMCRPDHLWFVATSGPYAVIATLVVAAARRLPWPDHGRWPCPPGPGCWCRRCP